MAIIHAADVGYGSQTYQLELCVGEAQSVLCVLSVPGCQQIFTTIN